MHDTIKPNLHHHRIEEILEDAMCPRADLQVTMTTINANGYLAERQKIRVMNKGGAAASNFHISVYSSSGSSTNMTKHVAGLAAGASMSFEFYPVTRCDYDVKVSVASHYVVNEFNELNNNVQARDSCVK